MRFLASGETFLSRSRSGPSSARSRQPFSGLSSRMTLDCKWSPFACSSVGRWCSCSPSRLRRGVWWTSSRPQSPLAPAARPSPRFAPSGRPCRRSVCESFRSALSARPHTPQREARTRPAAPGRRRAVQGRKSRRDPRDPEMQSCLPLLLGRGRSRHAAFAARAGVLGGRGSVPIAELEVPHHSALGWRAFVNLVSSGNSSTTSRRRWPRRGGRLPSARKAMER